MKHAANIITVLRIALSIALLFCNALSSAFYILYLSAGITDMIDGAIARKLGIESELGSRLDTLADFVLIAICMIKLMPVIGLEKWMWIWILVIAIIKVINIVSGFVMRKKFVAVHSVMNKVTGLVLFIFPLTLSFIELRYSAAIVLAVATFASVQEGHFIRTGRY